MLRIFDIKQGMLGLVAGTALAGLVLAAPAKADETVTLAHSSPLGVNFADVMFGMQLGFFKEEGIELNLISLKGAPVTVPQVANKAIEFAFAEPSYLMGAMDKGETLPVQYVYDYYRVTTNDFTVLADSPIQSIADFKGKTVGIGSLGWSGHMSMMRKALSNHDMDMDSDINLVAIGIGPAAWEQLKSGAVDVAALYGSQSVQMERSGMDIRRIAYPDDIRSVFQLGLLAHQDTIRDKPELIAKMGRAIAKSTIACSSAWEACARALWTFDPTSRPAADKEAEWIATGVATLQENYKTASYFPNGDPVWGQFPDKALDTFLGALHEGGIIKQADLPVTDLFTNDFVEKFNDFDEAEVKARAAAHTGN